MALVPTRATYAALLALAALDAAGYSVIAPVIPAIGEQTGSGPGVVGLLVAAFAVGQLVGFPLAGRAVQRRGARWVLGGSLLLMAAGDLGFVLGSGLEWYFPARLVQGVGAGGLWMGVTLGVLERFPGEEYRRLTGILAAYSVGGVAGPALGAVGGIRGPFLLHLLLVACALPVVVAVGAARKQAGFGSDSRVLRTRGFLVASAGITVIAAGYGALEGSLPLHFATSLAQAEIAALLVGTSVVLGVAAAAAGRLSPRLVFVAGMVAIPIGIELAGATASVPAWIVALAIIAVGFGLGEAGALGILLETTGTTRIVLAMVVWSQVWAVGYFAGPALSGLVAETAGFAAIGVVPLVPALVALALVSASGRRARA